MFRCFNKKSKQLRLCSAGFNQDKVEELLFVLGKIQTLSRGRRRRERKKPP